MLKLNLGSGPQKIEGFINLDRKTGQEVFPLPYETGSVDVIRASHILEHFPEWQVADVVNEWARVLKPGGVIRIAVPDLEKIMHDPQEKWALHIMGGQTDATDYHKSVWTKAKLTRLLYDNGFWQFGEWSTEILDCASYPFSLNIDGVRTDRPARPAPAPDCLDIKITGIMSLPRLGWNASWGCIADALAPFKIPVLRYTGAFWGQCMQNCLEEALNNGTDWALTFDYDTVFTRKNLDRMLGVFGSNPDYDALASMQPKRATGEPLMTVEKDGEMQSFLEVDGSCIKARTAHFGMTLIRLERLKDLPKPWFHSKPGEGGSWKADTGKVDEDIWFWKLWEEYGRTLYVDPLSKIGHLEMEVSHYDSHFNRVHATFEQWQKTERGECSIKPTA